MYRGNINPLGIALAPLLALCSWISLNPYFFWGAKWHMAFAGMVSGFLAVAAFALGDRPRRNEVVGFTLIVFFVLYISALPKVDGTFTRWYFVVPTMLALAIYSDERRREILESFSWIFAISLVPGILISIGSIAALPINFEHLPLANPVMAAAKGYYLQVPGALLLGGNSTILPWGGVLYRLCAVYDEPGMVGTVAVMLLAANRFRLNSPVFYVIFIGGILSCSLAFCLMAVVGFTFRSVVARSFKSLVPSGVAGLVGLLVIGIITLPPPSAPEILGPDVQTEEFPVSGLTDSKIQGEAIPGVTPKSSRSDSEARLENTLGSNGAQSKAAEKKIRQADKVSAQDIPPPALRQTEHINNRSLPEMKKLVARYWDSDAKTILFGVSSDASVVYGGVSQVATRLLTDFGLIGTLLFASGLISLAFAITKNAESRLWVLLFFALFALSIYQRPVVWMPYAFMLFICCSTFAGRKSLPPAQVGPSFIAQLK